MRTFIKYVLYCTGIFFSSIVIVWGGLYAVGLAFVKDVAGEGEDKYSFESDIFGQAILISIVCSLVSWIIVFRLSKQKKP